jgi:DNA-binding FadR family transcriptional regulator
MINQTNNINNTNNNMRLESNSITLVDEVENSLLSYFKENNLKCGDSIPTENELAESLGVARSVIREALSRFKMLGLINTRPRKGMVLTEPYILGGMQRIIEPQILGEENILDILGFRIALEIGISSDIFQNIKPEDIRELEDIVKIGEVFANNSYAPQSESAFHAKLYEITGNKTISQFQKIIHPVMTFVKSKFKDNLESINVEISKRRPLVTHAGLLGFIKCGDEEGYKKAIEQHFEVYKILMRRKQELNKK